MLTTFAFYGVLSATFAYLALYGGRTGLWGGSLLITTSLLSLAVTLAFDDTQIRVLLMTVVDILSLGWRLALAMWSNRRWPIWVAGFQVNVVAAHISIWFVPNWKGELYYAMITVWAIPTLLAMIIGTLVDNRQQQKSRYFSNFGATL
jgi:peptidoglycan/LPS O-acetylase OafA/YrhL